MGKEIIREILEMDLPDEVVYKLIKTYIISIEKYEREQKSILQKNEANGELQKIYDEQLKEADDRLRQAIIFSMILNRKDYDMEKQN